MATVLQAVWTSMTLASEEALEIYLLMVEGEAGMIRVGAGESEREMPFNFKQPDLTLRPSLS